MRLYLINPSNPLVSITKVKESRWNRYRVWKPLGLMVLAGLSPPEWEISIVDENLGAPDYSAMPRPDLVGITAFTSQANRAYEVAAYFRSLGVPVVMGGIHATMCLDEVMERVDSVVTGEAESIWPEVLEDARYKHLSLDGIIEEMISCDRTFYSMPRILRRMWGSLWQRRKPLITLVGNLSFRTNLRLNCKAYADFKRQRGNRHNSVRES